MRTEPPKQYCTTPIRARRFVRKMRGATQAWLVEIEHGQFCVVKHRNNPHGTGALVHDWLGAVLLRHIGIASPEPVIVEFTREFIDSARGVASGSGPEWRPQTGYHCGSRYPVCPDEAAVYDFLPDTLVHQIVNVSDFVGTLCVDKWTAKSDARQAVFVRCRSLKDVVGPPHNKFCDGFVAIMIDHGGAFSSPQPHSRQDPTSCMYSTRSVYQAHDIRDLEPWLVRISAFPEAVVQDALAHMPPEWVLCRPDLERTINFLFERRHRIAEIFTRHGREIFLGWASH
jgi:hypothetical protein